MSVFPLSVNESKDSLRVQRVRAPESGDANYFVSIQLRKQVPTQERHLEGITGDIEGFFFCVVNGTKMVNEMN